jgi:hypothetical protein
MHGDDEMSVFLVDGVVGDNGPDEFADDALRIMIGVANPKGRIRVITSRFGCHDASAWPVRLRARMGNVHIPLKSRDKTQRQLCQFWYLPPGADQAALGPPS